MTDSQLPRGNKSLTAALLLDGGDAESCIAASLVSSSSQVLERLVNDGYQPGPRHSLQQARKMASRRG